jgi:hypothetical protein
MAQKRAIAYLALFLLAIIKPVCAAKGSAMQVDAAQAGLAQVGVAQVGALATLPIIKPKLVLFQD